VKGRKHEEKKRSKKKEKVPKRKTARSKEEESDDGNNFLIKHKIHVGQIILGSVLHVFRYGIIVSLPNRMTGYLPVMYLSQSYNDLLHEVAEGKASSTVHEVENLYSSGHLLVTKVISVVHHDDGSSKITLSVLPQDVNCELTASLLSKHSIIQCAVASEEENGYVMETGIRNIRSAFLSKKYVPKKTQLAEKWMVVKIDGRYEKYPLMEDKQRKIENTQIRKRLFGVGSVLLCAVKKTIVDTEDTDEMSINLSALPSYVNKEINLVEKNINVASIFPGSLVSGTVARVISAGLELSFGEFRGFVKKENLTSKAEKVENFKIGQKVSARVLYIAELPSEIVCSMNTKLCSESSPEGAYFTLPEDSYGFCPKRNLDKYKKETKKKQLQVSSSYKCRVTHIHLIDQLYNIVLESKENTSGALFHVGKLVSVKIAELHPNEALAVIDKTRKIGRIPKLHLTDSNMSHLEEKCAIGRVFKGRILKYVPGKDPVLTFKTDLVTSELPIVTEVSENSVGIITLGCIVKIYKKNFLVEFFNDCKALVLGKDIPPHLRKDLQAHFQVGSVVKCKITTYEDAEKRLFASLLTNVVSKNTVTSENNVTGNDKVELKSGSLQASPVPKDIVNCKIISVDKENVRVIIEGSNEKGCIPLYHFADYVGESKSVFRLLNEGDEIRNVVVFAETKSDLILSVKPSVYHYVREFQNGKLEKTSICPSVVKQCFEDKILVTVMEKKDESEHVIPKSFVIKEKLDSILNIGVEEGQTLFVRRLRSKKARFCSRLEKVLSNNRTSGLQVLYDTLLQEAIIKKLCSEIKSLKLKDAVIGASYEGKIIHISKAGTLVRVSELGLEGVIHPSHYNDNCTPKMNETLEVRVLNVNYYELCLELTARRDIEEYFCKKDHNLKVKQEAKCDILLIKRTYIIGRLLNLCPGQIVYLPSRRHINDFSGRHSYYEIGKEYDLVIEHIDEELVLANLKVHTEKEFLGVSKELPSFIFSSLYLRSFADDILLDETRYTQHDFKMRASAKIERVSNWLETKKMKKKVEDLNKWETLKNDEFPQEDKEMYWKNILEKREMRKKLKKEKFGPVKAKKRKFNISFDENATEENDILNNDDSKDNVMTDKSDNLATSVQRKAKLKSKTKKRKLDLNNEDVAMKENHVNVTKKNSNSEPMSEDDSHDSKTDKDKISFLKIETNGFDWSGQILDTQKEEDEDSDDDEIENAKEQKSVKKLSKYEKSLKGKAEEKRTRELELERLDDELGNTLESLPPLFGSLNAETEKARAVASRALATIPPTKEEDRLALWNVSLRLEEADDLIKKMVKKHSKNREVWIKAFLYCFKANELTEARNMLDRSLLSLPKADHVEVINRFAQLELKQGDVERGKTVFETLLNNFPKRLDIWNVYADLLLKQNEIEGCRIVLERITGLKLKLKPMRNAFKKLLEFEKKYGTPKRVEAVKAKVEEYVTAALAEEN
ncbi:Protein RRP5-like protein, partial [Armadillidium vulgare]